jgi:endonuclease/exonuclease/phosphatase family metal-dependent hydrolase
MTPVRILALLLGIGLLPAPSALHAQAVRLMSYNIRYDNPADGEDAWPVRRELLAAQIRFHQPDVLGVQEALHHQLSWLQAQLGPYARVGVGRDDGGSKGEYTAILYRTDRFELLDSATFWLSPTPDKPSVGWDAALPRICTRVLLQEKTSGRRLWVYNTHFDHMGENARLQSALLLVDSLRAISSTEAGVVLMGDLNAEAQQPPVQALGSWLQDAMEASQQPPFGPEGTFNGFRFQEPVRLRIDYIFTGRGMPVERFATLSDSRNCHYPSDHLPVVADIRL